MKTLNDFKMWLINTGYENSRTIQLIDKYEKSFNEAPVETFNVSNNEQSEEDCTGCYHNDTCIYAELNNICSEYIDNTQSD